MSNPGPEMTLALPDWAECDTVARRLEPAVLWPVGAQPLLAHWMDEARRRGASAVKLYCADRPHLVRAWLDGGVYWSCPVEVVACPVDRYPAAAEWADHLPGEEPFPVPENGAELVHWWLDRNLAWLVDRDTHARLLDTPHPEAEGGWIGPRASIHPAAKLHPPFWIGADTRIGPRAIIGPHAIIGPRCVIEADASVQEAVVLDDTFVGPHVALQGKIADGGILIDTRRGCRVDIAESFILAGISRRGDAVPWHERLLAAALWLPAMLLAIGRTADSARTVTTPAGPIELRDGHSGPLLARRAAWLSAVIAGRLRLVGPLPRAESDCARLPADAANLLRAVYPGVFSVADLHGCHNVGEGDEPTHALFAAAEPRSATLVLRGLPRLLVSAPRS